MLEWCIQFECTMALQYVYWCGVSWYKFAHRTPRSLLNLVTFSLYGTIDLRGLVRLFGHKAWDLRGRWWARAFSCYIIYSRCICLIFHVLGFAKFNLLWCLSSFLGAGLGERMQKLLGAHQERTDHRNDREHGWFHFTDQITFPYWKFYMVRPFYNYFRN